MNYSFALCDDEIEHLNILNRMIMTVLQDKGLEIIIDKYESGFDLLHNIENDINKYDIIFLDIQMSKIDGLEIGSKIRKLNNDIIIIYVTGFVGFAINAFEIRAFDYILKPINVNKLEKAIFDAFARIQSVKQHDSENSKCLIINQNKKIASIRLDDIIYLEKLDNKVIIISVADRYEVYDSLGHIKNKLDEDMFIQTHQGYIVNKKKISNYENQQIILTQKYKVPVSKKNIKVVKKAFFESLR